jgi:hypothetical protein
LYYSIGRIHQAGVISRQFFDDPVIISNEQKQFTLAPFLVPFIGLFRSRRQGLPFYFPLRSPGFGTAQVSRHTYRCSSPVELPALRLIRSAALVRGVVKALADPEREGEARTLLHERFGAGNAKGLEVLLASASLEGIDLTRDRDFGRDVRL